MTRLHNLRVIVTGLCLMLCLDSIGLADESPQGPSFRQRGGFASAGPSMSAGVSPDGRSLSLLFQHLGASLPTKDPESAAATRSLAFQWPLEQPLANVSAKLTLRGFAQTQAGSTITVVLIVGTQSWVINPQVSDSDQFSYGPVAVTIPDNSAFLTGAIVVLAQHSAKERAEASVHVDSLDLVLDSPSKVK
jgi:hypothetical protein